MKQTVNSNSMIQAQTKPGHNIHDRRPGQHRIKSHFLYVETRGHVIIILQFPSKRVSKRQEPGGKEGEKKGVKN
jgi:hypothetical protein